MQTNTVTYKNSTIFYKKVGTGPMVVLIHGFAENSTVWQYQAAYLKVNFKLIIPDLPGSGQSQFIDGATIETYADVIKLIIDTELQHAIQADTSACQSQTIPDKNTGTVTMIGHSMGGYITLAFAEKYPQYLHCFGLFHSSAFADTSEKKEARTKSINFIKANGVSPFLKTSTPALFTKKYAAENPEAVMALIEEGSKCSAATLIQYYQAMIDRPDRTAVLKEFSNPILFIVGEQDTAVPLSSSLQQVHLPLRSFIHILHDAAHMGLWEQKEAANKMIHNFLINNF